MGASHANEVVCIDFLQDLHVDSEGFKHILVFIDAFTRLVTLYPTKDTSFHEIIKPLLTYCCFYGTPRFLHSDNASSFLSEPFKQLTKLLQVSHSLAAPYSHEQNAIVERVIRSVRERMDELKDSNPSVDWSTLSLLAQRAINAVPHESTKYAPAVLTFGRNVFSPMAVLDTESTFEEKWLQDLQAAQDAVTSQARRLREEQLQNRERENVTLYVHKFLPGDWVLRLKRTRNNKGSLDRTTYEGPFQVIRQIDNEVIYKTARSNIERRGFITHFKPYVAAEGVNPMLEQLKNYSDWGIVERVVGHYFIWGSKKRKSKSSLMFKIKWLDDENIYHEPATNESIFTNIVVQDYIKATPTLTAFVLPPN